MLHNSGFFLYNYLIFRILDMILNVLNPFLETMTKCYELHDNGHISDFQPSKFNTQSTPSIFVTSIVISKKRKTFIQNIV